MKLVKDSEIKYSVMFNEKKKLAMFSFLTDVDSSIL